MATHGLNTAKLTANLDRLFTGWVDQGTQPSVQALVIRHGEVAYDKAFGWANREAKRAIKPDDIFRIFSMSKVFTSVCMLMLMEEGRVKLHDPVSKFVPAFSGMKVAEYDAAGHIRLVPPKREITVRDLFTMASGVPYPGGDTASEKAMERVFEAYDAAARRGERLSAEQFLQELVKVPLTAHPGEHWWYGFSIDILGALVEVIADKRLGDFMQERIFTPLGLVDTGFYVPEEKRSRFVTMYDVGEDGGLTPVKQPPEEESYYQADALHSGGGGLVSTAADVAKFAQMLLGFGKLGDTRLLSRKSVELMRMNQLTEQQLKDYDWDTQRGYGYGLGVRTMMHPEIAGYGSVGEFAWDGAAGTWFCVDPQEDMVCIFLAQTMPGRHYQFVPYFAQVVYGAIED